MPSNREALAERVSALRVEGYQYREIADQLGIKLSYARALGYDPTGDKQRDRMRKYDGTCVDCGAATKGANGRGVAPPKRCLACHLAFIEAPHGGAGSRYDSGCRCDLCRDANRLRSKRWAETTTAPIIHGRASSYTNRGCRCDLCRKAGVDDERAKKAKRLARGAFTHGTATGYTYGCRCDECKAAQARSTKDYRDRKKAAS